MRIARTLTILAVVAVCATSAMALSGSGGSIGPTSNFQINSLGVGTPADGTTGDIESLFSAGNELLIHRTAGGTLLFDAVNGNNTVGMSYDNGTHAVTFTAVGVVTNTDTSFVPPKDVVANFACAANSEGAHYVANNCNAACTVGGTCTAGGTTHCEIYCNGTTLKETGM